MKSFFEYLEDVNKDIKSHLKNKKVKSFSKEEAKEIGDSLKVDWNKTKLEQFRIGLADELEHGDIDKSTDTIPDKDGHDDYKTLGKIVLTHLNKDSNYYTKERKL